MAKTTVSAGYIAANAITSTELAANSVTAASISAGAILSVDVGANSVTSTAIAANAVSSSEVASNAISTAQIASNAVTAASIATNAVGADQISPNAVKASELASDALSGQTFSGDVTFSGNIDSGGSLTTSTGVIMNSGNDKYWVRYSSASTTGLYYQSTGGEELQYLYGGARKFGVKQTGNGYFAGSLGIGTDSLSQGKVDILDAGDYDAHTGHGLTINSNSIDAYTSMYMGTDDSIDAAYIQSAAKNTSFTSKKLLLNPNGGNVSIGTSSSNGVLSVAGSISLEPGGGYSTTLSRPQLVRGADGELKMAAGSDTSSIITFHNSTSAGATLGERLRILGNNLHLNGGADCRIQLGSGGAGANSTSNNTVHIRGDNTSLKFMAASGGDVIFEQNGTSRFVFGTNDWYFGNYTNATETLNFRTSSNGTTRFNFYDNNSTEGCYIKHTGQSVGGKIIYGARWDDDEDWMAIDLRQSSSGGGYDCRVGIGTTTPAVPLVIQVSASQANAEMRFQSGTYTTDHFKMYANQAGRFYIQNVSTSSGVYLQHNANAWTSASDERLKENIVELDNVLPKIINLRAVKYNFISDEEDSTKIGFIAQDWQTDFSEVVNDTDLEELGINYTETIPVLLKAIQELKQENDSLKARIEALET